MSVTRRGFLAMLGAAGVLAACGGDSGGAASSADEASATDGAGDAPPEAGGTTPTVLALGEEYLLADLLALRIRPMASTANVVLDDGFAGLDEFDTDGIVALPSTEPNLELLADYRADVVVANTFVTDYLGRDLLEGVGGELVVVPDTLLAIGFTLRPGRRTSRARRVAGSTCRTSRSACSTPTRSSRSSRTSWPASPRRSTTSPTTRCGRSCPRW